MTLEALIFFMTERNENGCISVRFSYQIGRKNHDSPEFEFYKTGFVPEIVDALNNLTDLKNQSNILITSKIDINYCINFSIF